MSPNLAVTWGTGTPPPALPPQKDAVEQEATGKKKGLTWAFSPSDN